MHKWIKSNSKFLFVALGFICLTFLLLGFFFASSNSVYLGSKDHSELFNESSEKIVPTRIKIPDIGVDALVTSVGLTELKSMESPEKPEDTAWFSPGVSPGEKGNSVIAGHRGWKTGEAVFDHLYKLEIGDKVYVEREDRETLVFVVREMRVYNAEDMAPEVWSEKDTAHLNLITCFGDWNVSTGTSDKRLVVFTDMFI